MLSVNNVNNFVQKVGALTEQYYYLKSVFTFQVNAKSSQYLNKQYHHQIYKEHIIYDIRCTSLIHDDNLVCLSQTRFMVTFMCV